MGVTIQGGGGGGRRTVNGIDESRIGITVDWNLGRDKLEKWIDDWLLEVRD